MSAAAILAIVVATGEASNPTTTALVATAAEALGSGTAIRLVESADPAAADAHAIERELGAGAVVAVVWADSAGQSHTRALLLLHVAGTDAWTRRTMTFAASDALAERGRMLGYAVGSMWPEGQGAAEGAATDAAADATPGPAKTTAAPATVTPSSSAAASASAAPSAPAAPALSRRFAFVVAGLGALGSGGDGPAFGGSVAGLWVLAPAWAARLGLGVRADDVPALPGSDVIGTLGAGVEWWPAWAALGHAGATSGSGIWRAGLRADALAVGQWVRYSPPAGSETQQRLLPGMDAAVQSAVALGSRAQLRAAIGVELSLGKTDLRRGDSHTTVATIPAVQMFAEVGLAIGF